MFLKPYLEICTFRFSYSSNLKSYIVKQVNSDMRLLIAAGAKDKFVYFKELVNSLNQLGVQCKLVKDVDYARGFPSKRFSDWFGEDNEETIDFFKNWFEKRFDVDIKYTES